MQICALSHPLAARQGVFYPGFARSGRLHPAKADHARVVGLDRVGAPAPSISVPRLVWCNPSVTCRGALSTSQCETSVPQRCVRVRQPGARPEAGPAYMSWVQHVLQQISKASCALRRSIHCTGRSSRWRSMSSGAFGGCTVVARSIPRQIACWQCQAQRRATLTSVANIQWETLRIKAQVERTHDQG